jgi:uncharacterized membrane protein HdeD (DUF308 family)
MKKSTKIMLVVTGILLIVLGIVCICNPVETLFSMAWLIGFLTLLAGVSKLVFGLRTQNFLPNSGTRILTGVFDVILGIFLLFNNIFVAISLPLIFAIWLIIEGIILVVQSFDYKKADYQGWWWILLMGIAVVVLGFFAMKNLEVTGMTISIMFGCAVMLLGFAYLIAFFGINKFQKKVKQVKDAFRE